MQPEDRKEFNVLLVTAMAVYERQITAAIGDLFFAALGVYSMDQVRDGIARHLQDPVDGKFSPKPADVIRQIQGVVATDGRPGKDQAWSIALQSLDESDTVLITPEILAALDVAKPLLELRDKVAARMAFVEVYEKLVVKARREGQPLGVIVSLGDDKARRQVAIEDGLRTGLLTQEQAKPHLMRIEQETQRISAEGSAIAGLLAGPKVTSTEELRERWKSVRGMIGPNPRDRRAEKTHAEATEQRADTERRKQAVEDKIHGKTGN